MNFATFLPLDNKRMIERGNVKRRRIGFPTRNNTFPKRPRFTFEIFLAVFSFVIFPRVRLTAYFPSLSLYHINNKIVVIQRKGKLGLGSAYKVGFKKALKEGARVIITMDADLSHDPSAIPTLLSGLRRADLVIGSR